MRTLAKYMAWMLKCIAAGRATGLALPQLVRATAVRLVSVGLLAVLPARAALETDAQLEAMGKHRVRSGETMHALAKRAGISTNLFYRMNGSACGWWGPEKLKAGEIVTMKNPNEFKKVTGSEKFAGRYSLHEYWFSGVGEAHVREGDSEPSFCCGGSDVSCWWRVPWPESGCGLSNAALEKFRERIINICFGANFYEVEQWRPPKTIDAVEKEFKDDAWRLFNCDNDGWRTNDSHFCSHWTFVADAELTWPFGMKSRGEEWYERPVICFKNAGYSNDGGNGCHSYVSAHVYRLPDGKELDERDYFREDRMDELLELVLDRLFVDNKLTIEDTLEKDRSKIRLKPGTLSWNVAKNGVTWWVNAYHIFPGCCGVTRVTIPWKDLYGFLKDPAALEIKKFHDFLKVGSGFTTVK